MTIDHELFGWVYYNMLRKYKQFEELAIGSPKIRRIGDYKVTLSVLKKMEKDLDIPSDRLLLLKRGVTLELADKYTVKFTRSELKFIREVASEINDILIEKTIPEYERRIVEGINPTRYNEYLQNSKNIAILTERIMTTIDQEL